MLRRSALRVDSNSAFLNIPYDTRFNNLYIAYIAGLSAFGLVPRATIEIPGGQRRLDRTLSLIKTCRYSFHDLSRVQTDRIPPRTPRFNMPFELGLTVSWSEMPSSPAHTWFVFEAVAHRIEKSLSDLNGTDVYIHSGTVDGVLRELRNALVRRKHQPTMQELRQIFSDLKRASSKLKREHGTSTLYDSRMFRELVVLAREASKLRIPPLAH